MRRNAAFVMLSANDQIFKSSRIRTINRRPSLTTYVFISFLCDVKAWPTQYSKRVGDVVPGVVAVLFSPAEVAG